jgi:dipeptidyl aminopeptidase/acylaminoacyl peptidase
MRSPSIWLVLVAAALVACGGAEPKPTAPPLTTATAVATAPPVADAGAPATKVEEAPPVDPTVLGDAEKAKDAQLAPKAAALVDAYFNAGGRLSKDKKKLFFRSNRDGNWQGYVADVDKPSAAPVKLTQGAERVTSLQLTPDQKWLVYTSDQGADENFRIFRMAPDGKDPTNLTPTGTLHRDVPFIPKLRPNELVYSASDKKEPKGFVYVTSMGGEEKRVYTDEMPISLEDVSPDGSRALFVRVVSLSEQILFQIDLDAGKAARVYPPEGRTARITAASYSSDGKHAFIATDDGQEAAYVLDMSPASRTIAGRYKEELVPTGQIIGLSVSQKGDLVAMTVDAGDRTDVRILDVASMKVKTAVKAAPGTHYGGAWADDGSAFVLNTSTPDAPSNLALVDASGAVKPLRTEARPELAKLPALEVSSVRADTFDAFKIPLNVYLPKPRPAGKLLTIVVVHGGPASSSRLGWNPFARFFAAQGWAVVEPNIRGSTGFGRAYEMADDREKRGDALKDLEAVNKWVKAQAWCDANRVVVFGGSYGGYMTLMALTRQPDLWRAGVDLVGIANLRTFLKSTAQQIRAVFVREFGDLENDVSLLNQWSPHRDFDKIKAPLFVYQGANDPRVPRPESDLIVRTLREKKIPVEYMVAANEGHSLDRRETKVEFLTRTARFLSENVK